jgi:plastocyanin
MQQFVRTAVLVNMIFVLGACGTGTSPSSVATSATSAGPASAPASAAPASAAPASAGAGGASTAAACAPAAAGTAPTVTVTIKNFAFSPEPVTVKVGDVIGWTNGDSADHTATLDDDSCTTDSIANGETESLVFTAPGTYPYHCKIHPTQMMGTITVS